jgi:UDP-glucose 4-epimerase
MAGFFITGAAGFIGKAVISELLSRNLEIIGLSRGRHDIPNGVLFLDLNDFLSTSNGGGNICIHLAADNRATSEITSVESVNEAVELAQKIVACGFSKVVFASSALVYGNHFHRSLTEEDIPCPEGDYAATKQAVENVFLVRGQTVARIANVYGPEMSANNILSDILKQLPGQQPIALRNTRPVRDFIRVDDVARGLVDLALGFQGGIFNLSTGIGTSVETLARTVLEHAGQPNRRIVSHINDNTESKLVIDATKMKSHYGWRARVSLNEGIGQILADKKWKIKE